MAFLEEPCCHLQTQAGDHVLLLDWSDAPLGVDDHHIQPTQTFSSLESLMCFLTYLEKSTDDNSVSSSPTVLHIVQVRTLPEASQFGSV